MKTRYFIAIVLIVVIGAALGYLFTRNKNATEDGAVKTYQDSDFGFSFQYPDSYVAEKHLGEALDAAMETVTLIDRDFVAENASEGPISINIVALVKPEDMTLVDWAKGPGASYSNLALAYDSSATSSYSAITFGGFSGIRYRWSGLYEADTVVLEEDVDRHLVYLLTVTWINAEDSIRKDFETIVLPTFKAGRG